MANGLEKVGAAWIKSKKKGDGKYLSATVEVAIPQGASLMIFRNDHKKEDRHPDYHVYCPTDELDKAENDRRVEDFDREREKAAAVDHNDDIPF